MHTDRRTFIGMVAASSCTASLVGCAAPKLKGEASMYGLIGKMKAVPGQRDALIDILLEAVPGMPGCFSYVVAKDPTDPDAIWVTEVWDSAATHKAALATPVVRQAMAGAKPLIAGFGERFETIPVGGFGLNQG